MNNRSQNWLLPLRLAIGFGFAAHGYAKLSRGPANFGKILGDIGLPEPNVVAWIISVLELIGGVSVMAGLFVVPLAVPLSLIMLTAMFTVHLRYGFSSIRLKSITPTGAEFGPIGYEMNLLYLAGLITLALAGPSRLSLDYWFGGIKLRRKFHPFSATNGSAGMTKAHEEVRDSAIIALPNEARDLNKGVRNEINLNASTGCLLARNNGSHGRSR